MLIGEVAARAGVPAKTIRFWEDQSLLPLPDRTPSGYRDYDPAVLERLAFIRHAQSAGLTLEAIRQVLEVRDDGEPPCVHVTALIARRLAEVQDPADCRGYCSIITG
jgi:MerR family transcriptional regulator, Zn(II)-responsive regulator of zntA